MKAILLSKDLLFITRVKEVGAQCGCQVVVAKSEEALRSALGEAGPTGVVLVDLEKPPLGLEQVAVALQGTQGWRVCSFYSHVRHEAAEEARAALGGDVMPRSRFVQLLPHILSSV